MGAGGKRNDPRLFMVCVYYGYPLTDNVFERTGIDYAKGINFCYHEMENNRKAQEN